MTDYNIPRDGYGRPMLYPPDGERKIGYSRPSTLGKDLDDKKFLIPWEQTMVAIGLAKNRHLFGRIQALLAKKATWSSHKKEFQVIMSQAKEAAGWKDQAERGTSIHDLAEAGEVGGLDSDDDWRFVPEHLKPVAQAYMDQIVPHMNVLARECFVAVDRKISLPSGDPQRPREVDLRAAGSVDRISEFPKLFPGKRHIVDIKSGRDAEFRMGVSGQVYLYAVGKLYSDDVVTQDIDWANWIDNPVNCSRRANTYVDLDYAIMLQAPKFAVHGKWTWGVYLVPLDKGREIIEGGQMARLARNVPAFERVDL